MAYQVQAGAGFLRVEFDPAQAERVLTQWLVGQGKTTAAQAAAAIGALPAVDAAIINALFKITDSTS